MTKKQLQEACEIAFEYRRGDDPPGAFEIDCLVVDENGLKWIGNYNAFSGSKGNWALRQHDPTKFTERPLADARPLRWKKIGRTANGGPFLTAFKNTYSKLL